MPYINNRGVRIHYEVEGDGPPLVLGHGFGDSVKGWYDYGYVSVLRNCYQLILIDGRGHGDSDKPHAPEAYALDARANDVIGVLDALEIDRAHYLGYSLGGWVGLGLAMYAHERICSLMLGGAQPYGQSMALFRQTLEVGLQGLQQFVHQMADPYPINAARFLVNDVQALHAAVARDRPDISSILPAVAVPCLLFAGEADPLHPRIKRCSQALPTARFVSLPDLNHIQTILRSDRLLPPVLQFLEHTTDVREI